MERENLREIASDAEVEDELLPYVCGCLREVPVKLVEVILRKSKPIDMLLFCPRCSNQHVDKAEGEWKNPPHATHTCQACGLLWRPSNFNTNGVASIAVIEPQHYDRIGNCFINQIPAEV